MTGAASGRCLFGAVCFRVTGPRRAVVAHHCVHSRRSSGHHLAATEMARAGLAVSGDMRWFEASPGALRGSGRLSIFAGGLDATTGLRLARDVFGADDDGYHELSVGLPQAQGVDSAVCQP